ncbi:MAG: leucine-rich repeat domain-containing protein, partial [Chloroflexota bacterium]|nr:leucine-rich repeat domain-containing protein [Chloroflexota bacterium]
PPSVDFGDVEVGSFVEGVVTVSNLGTADLIIGTVAVSDPLAAPFSITVDNCSGETIAPGGNRTITIRFEPGSIGAFSDSFDIPSNDPDTPVATVGVSGQGIAADISVSPPSVDFGDVEVGSFVEGVVTVSNLGTADLIIGTVAVSDPLTAPFTIIADNCSGETIAPGGNRTIKIRFEPGSIGAFSDSFDIPSNDPDIPVVTVAVGGQGIAADISVSPPSVDFGDVEVGSFVEGVVTVSNLGTADLIIGTVAVSDPLTAPFTIIADNCSGETIAPGGNRTIKIRFEPGSIGAFSDSFDIPSNDPDELITTVSLGGTGIYVPELSITPNMVDFGLTDTEASIYISNIGTGTLNWSIEEPLPSWLSASPMSGNVTTDTSTVLLIVDRSELSGAGVHNFVLSVSSDGGAGTINIEITHNPVVFVDPNLESAVRDAISKPSGDILEDDLLGLTTLIASDLGITDLSGIEYCKDLEHIELDRNEVTDISPLNALVELTYVKLDDNDISDILGLDNLANLTYLSLSNNNIEDDDLATIILLSDLAELDLKGNLLTDISILTSLLQLETLDLSENLITDLQPLVNSVGIDDGDEVWIEQNDLDLTSGGEAAVAIWTLKERGVNLHHDPIESFFTDTELEDFIAEQLDKPAVLITVADLETLSQLDASGLGIVEVDGLEHCVNLTELRLNSNNIEDISALSSLNELTTLVLTFNNIVDISPLSSLTNLTELHLSSNDVIDIGSLANLDRLTGLYLSANRIVDISAIGGLVRLRNLDLSYNAIEDVSPLSFNSGFGEGDSIWLYGNYLDLAPESPTMLVIQELTSNGVTVYHDPWVVQFPDPNLEEAVRIVINLPTGDIHLDDLETLTSLDATGKGIENITGIEYCRNLERLLLADNDIDDLSPLAHLVKLNILFLSSNRIGDVAPLQDLVNLTILNLNNNLIVDVTPLSDMQELAQLYLDDNRIDDLSGLVNNDGLGFGDNLYLLRNNLDLRSVSPAMQDILTLKDRGVNVYHDEITVVFSDPNLAAVIRNAIGKPVGGIYESDLLLVTSLELVGRGIRDLSGIEYCVALAHLDLSQNHLTDISQLRGMTALTLLKLTSNQIADISPLGELTGMRVLFLGDCGIDNVSPLIGLTELSVLDLSGNNISDISPLVENTGLGQDTDIWINGNALDMWNFSQDMQDIWALEEKGVTVHHNPLEGLFSDRNLEMLIRELIDKPSDRLSSADVVGLTSLDASGRNVKDISGLEHCIGLLTLDLRDNEYISDISPLAGLTNLTHIYLDGNAVVDISPLAKLSGLEFLSLENNRIQIIDALSYLGNLNTLNISHNEIANILPLVTNNGLSHGDEIWLGDNALELLIGSDDVKSIEALKARGVNVHHDEIGGDADGVEEHGPSGKDENYDGNKDGIPDGNQDNVISIHSSDGINYVTFVCDDRKPGFNVAAIDNPSPDDMPKNTRFPYGFFNISLGPVEVGGHITVTIYLSEGTTVDTYWKYGPTPDNTVPHWYEFLYDGETGAQINGNVITLHFVDGKRGDKDLQANGIIQDPGAPVKYIGDIAETEHDSFPWAWVIGAIVSTIALCIGVFFLRRRQSTIEVVADPANQERMEYRP